METEEEGGAVELVRADLTTEVRSGSEVYGPGKNLLVPAGIAKMFGRVDQVLPGLDDSRASDAVLPASQSRRRT